MVRGSGLYWFPAYLRCDVWFQHSATGRPYAILRIASDRRYRAQDGSRLTDFISIKVRGPLAEWCAAYAVKGCKLTAHGDFETITFAEDPTRRPGFLIKATDVDFLSPKRAEDCAEIVSSRQEAAVESSGDGGAASQVA